MEQTADSAPAGGGGRTPPPETTSAAVPTGLPLPGAAPAATGGENPTALAPTRPVPPLCGVELTPAEHYHPKHPHLVDPSKAAYSSRATRSIAWKYLRVIRKGSQATSSGGKEVHLGKLGAQGPSTPQPLLRH